eukprot:4284367-Amphidinium_carterae.2
MPSDQRSYFAVPPADCPHLSIPVEDNRNNILNLYPNCWVCCKRCLSLAYDLGVVVHVSWVCQADFPRACSLWFESLNLVTFCCVLQTASATTIWQVALDIKSPLVWSQYGYLILPLSLVELRPCL